MSIIVTIQVPKVAIPYIDLTFLFFSIDISNSLQATVDSLDISTKAGSINAGNSDVYTTNTTIHTTAGSIHGKYTLGERLYLSASAGSISVSVAVDTTIKSTTGTFITRSDAGSTQVTLLAPLKHRNQIRAQHTSHAGSIGLYYPLDWEGIVEGQTTAGSIQMSGEGLEIVESDGRFARRYIKAAKGENAEEKGTVYISDSAGSIIFAVK
jgi:hypothetical protein